MNKRSLFIFITFFSLLFTFAQAMQKKSGGSAKPQEQQPQQTRVEPSTSGNTQGDSADKPQEQSDKPEAEKEKQKQSKKIDSNNPEKEDGAVTMVHKQGGLYGQVQQLDVKTVVMNKFIDYIFSEKGANLEAELNKNIVGGLTKGMGWIAAAGLITGCAGAVDTVATKKSSAILDKVLSWIEDGWTSVTRLVFHHNVKPVTSGDIRRWGRSIENMLRGLETIAEKSKTSASIGPNMGLAILNNLQKQDDDEDDESEGARSRREVEQDQKQTVDTNWKENASIFLIRIMQIVKEMQFRKEYYAKNDEILICLDSLETALVGDCKEIAVGDKKIVWGGIYARIANAQSLQDLATSQTAIALQLFYKHIEGLLAELDAWVSEKEGSKKQNNYSTNTHNPYGGSGYNNYNN